MKYHINPATGNANKCSASQGRCPHGGDDKHYTSKEAAQAAYEKDQAKATAVKTWKRKPTRAASKATAPKAVSGHGASGHGYGGSILGTYSSGHGYSGHGR